MARKPVKTDKSIQALKPEPTEYYNPIENHPKLFIRVRPNGSKEWFYKYHRNKKISFGAYPQTGLAVAFEKWHEVNQLLAKGIDPQHHRQASDLEKERLQNCKFNVIAWLWFDNLQQAPTTLKRKKSRLNELCDIFQDTPLDRLTTPYILGIFEGMQKQHIKEHGKVIDKAERSLGLLSEIFEFAIVKGYCEHNPVTTVKKHIEKATYENRPAIDKPLEFAKLLQDIANCDDIEPGTKHSLDLLALLFVRNGDLRHMKWRDVDFERCEWTFKPIKGRGKEIMVKEMTVPLAPKAIEILQQQHKITGKHEFVFHSNKSKYDVISDGTAGKLLKKLGYQNIHCAHGYRATATTLLIQELGFEKVIVEMAMGHIVKDSNGTAYARHEFLNERKEMMNQWADYLQALQRNEPTEKFKMIYRQNQNEVLELLIKSMGKDEILRLLEKA